MWDSLNCPLSLFVVHVMVVEDTWLSLFVSQVFLGLHDARDKRLATNRSVLEIILHPDFQPNNYNNDIAMVKLRDSVELNEVIRPVCLPTPHRQVGHILLINTTGNTVYCSWHLRSAWHLWKFRTLRRFMTFWLRTFLENGDIQDIFGDIYEA